MLGRTGAGGAGGIRPSTRDARVAVIGAMVGFVFCLVGVTAAVMLSGGGAASIGAGILVGGFSGVPFGAMLALAGRHLGGDGKEEPLPRPSGRTRAPDGH